jgi:tRNA pseudouridine38-40 synthase
MLKPERHRERIEPAPAYGLILKDIKYNGIRFEVDDYAWRTLQSRLFEIVSFHGSIYRIFSALIE